jgi:hypothetical protein
MTTMTTTKQKRGGSFKCHTVYPVNSDHDLAELDSVGFTVTADVAHELADLLRSLASQCEPGRLIDLTAYRGGRSKGRGSAKIRKPNKSK